MVDPGARHRLDRLAGLVVRTWHCRTCTVELKKETYHLDKGREGCPECIAHEIRVEIPTNEVKQ